MTTYNVYCDESCHLERDGQTAMVLGAVWCPVEKAREIAERIREIKVAHGQTATFEVKWSKVSPGGLPLYLALLDYFFDDNDLRFRALVVPDKSQLHHAAFGQSHDTWYYKMYYDMLKILLAREHHYRIYLDIKDSRSARKLDRLHEVLSNSRYDFDRRIIERMQHIHSHEVEQIQLADLLIGIVSYANRRLESSAAKQALVARMRERSGFLLSRSTLPREDKVNLFVWHARQAIA